MWLLKFCASGTVLQQMFGVLESSSTFYSAESLLFGQVGRHYLFHINCSYSFVIDNLPNMYGLDEFFVILDRFSHMFSPYVLSVFIDQYVE